MPLIEYKKSEIMKSQIANNELEKSEKSRSLLVDKNIPLLISVATN